MEDECKNLVENFVLTDSQHESLDGDECKKLVENFVATDSCHKNLENDLTDSWKIHIYHLIQ